MKLDPRHGQMLLASAGYYAGAIDGAIGRKSRDAIARIEANAAQAGLAYGSGWPTADWPIDRRLVAAAQRVLDVQGHDPGVIDGWYGHNTAEALTDWLSARAGVPSNVERRERADRPDPASLPRQHEVARVYGNPGADVRSKLTTVELPFSLRIDWNLAQTTRKITVHRLCAPSLLAAMVAIEETYGLDRMRALGIDRYAGAYHHRRMRGGSSWSMHAYGCAIDFYAAPNGLRTRCPDALFCKPEYKDFLDIMEAHNWLPAIRLWGADAMHFQQARP